MQIRQQINSPFLPSTCLPFTKMIMKFRLAISIWEEHVPFERELVIFSVVISMATKGLVQEFPLAMY